MFWYAVNTKPHCESQVEVFLSSLGFDVFFPRIKQMKLIRRKREKRISPLFPNYIFVRFDVEANLRAVKYARGVRRIVTFGSVPAIVSEDLIEGIRCRLLQDAWDTTIQKFRPGQIVRIQDGPLFGLEAIFEREMSESQRAVLLLHALAYQARVIVPLDSVVNL